MSPDPVNHDQLDAAIDRAFRGVERLLSSELRTIGSELRAINGRLRRLDALEQTVDGIDTRVTSVEAFTSSQERRLNDAAAKAEVAVEVERRLTTLEGQKRDLRRWLADHFPSLLLGAIAITVTIIHGL